MSHPIVAAVPHSEEAGDDAVALATVLARVQHLPVVLAAACLEAVGPRSRDYRDAVEQSAEQDLSAAAARVPVDVECTTRVVHSSSVVRALHELADELEASVLVLGPTHVGRVSRAFGGGVALGALHAAPCPVAVAPPGYAERHPDAPSTIGVAFVDTPEARDALTTAIAMAESRNGSLRVLTVLSDPAFSEPYLEASEGARSDLQQLRDHAEALIEEAHAAVAGRVRVDGSILSGDPAIELLKAADELDLLVLGSRGFGPLKRVLLGSVAAGVVHEAPCPVLMLPRGAHLHLEAGVGA